MYWYEEEVSHLEAKIASGEIRKGAHLFYGSSSLRLWDKIKEDLAPYDVENIAFGGSTLQACVHFFDRLVPQCEPKSIIFYAGDNDIGDGVYHADIMEHFESLLTKRAVHFGAIHFTFISVKPSPARHHYLHRIRLVNSYVKERLCELQATHYLDIHSKMYTLEGLPDRNLYGDDGLHMNEKGYQIWREAILKDADQIFVTS